MANEIYDSTWWGNTIQTASSIGTSTEMIQGQFNLTKIGDELVVNGDFSDGTNNWTQQLSANFSVNNGVATIQSTGSNSLIYQYVSPSSVSAILKIEFDVVSFTGQYFYISFSGYDTQITQTGKVVIYTSSSRSNNKFDIAPAPLETIVLNNVSVKEVRATTVEASKCLADAIHRIGIQDIQN